MVEVFSWNFDGNNSTEVGGIVFLMSGQVPHHKHQQSAMPEFLGLAHKLSKETAGRRRTESRIREISLFDENKLTNLSNFDL